MAIRVAINGFGRIGRLVYRIASQRADIEIVAVNDLVPADNLAYLLRYDTMHGRFGENVHAQGEEIVHGAHRTKCTAFKDPSQLPWKAMGVDYVIESFRQARKVGNECWGWKRNDGRAHERKN